MHFDSPYNSQVTSSAEAVQAGAGGRRLERDGRRLGGRRLAGDGSAVDFVKSCNNLPP